MSNDRLTSSDRRALILWVALAVAGALFAHKYFFAAFPEASVDLRVSRGEALDRARTFVSGLGENVSGYRTSVLFAVADDSADGHAKTYLERSLGLKEANRLMSSEVSLWYWEVRFFRPLQKEEFQVRVTPAGRIAGYKHVIEESRPGAKPDRAAAESAARQFLAAQSGTQFSSWDFLPEEASSEARPGRTDWSFTWEKHGFKAKDAPYRLRVTLDGGRLAGFGEYLQVPEEWQRDYEKLRAGNNALAQIFIFPYLLLTGMAIWLGIHLTRRGQTSWKLALQLGLLAAVLLFLQNLNDWPHWGADYDTNASFSSFIASRLGIALLLAIGSALTITLILPAAEPLYRSYQPDRLTLRNALTLRGIRSKEFFSAAVVGLSMAAFHIGFIVAFYMLASRLGAWAPQELNYENSVNTMFPWISGVAIGLLASTSEEFLFRLFAIPYLEKLTRSRWIAVIVPAFLWGFLHSNYPQEPAYIRGLEVGLIGIVAGLVMLRWGILATLIWHYTVDALLVGLLLIRSDNLYFKLSGAIVAAAALAPLAFSAVSYLLRGHFENAEDLLNRAAPVPEISLLPQSAAAEEAAAPRRYDALSPRMISALLLILLLGAGLVWRLKSPAVGDYLQLTVDARGARAAADSILRQKGVDPSSWHRAALLVDTTDPLANEFLRRRIGIPALDKIYAEKIPGALWRIRYFRDSQAEEYIVVLKPDGTLHSVHHILPEAAPGASLSQTEAVARAEKYLREEKKLDLSQWTLIAPNPEKMPHRTDYTLVWQENAPLGPSASGETNSSAQAHARVQVQLLGEEIAGYRTFIKIPEDWTRKQSERTLLRDLFSYRLPMILLLFGIPVAASILYLKRVRTDPSHSIPWKQLLPISVLMLSGYALVFAMGDRIPNALNQYMTAIPFKLMFIGLALALVLGAAMYSGVAALLFGMAWHYAARTFGEERLPRWSAMPAAYYRDALAIGLGGAASLMGLHALFAAVEQRLPVLHRSFPSSFGGDFDSIFPAGGILGQTLLNSLLRTGLLVLLAGFIAAELRSLRLRIPLFLLGVLALLGNWGNTTELLFRLLTAAIWLALVVWGVARVARFNLLGYLLVMAGTGLLGPAAALLAQHQPFYRASGHGLLLALGLFYLWVLMTWRLKIAPSQPLTHSDTAG